MFNFVDIKNSRNLFSRLWLFCLTFQIHYTPIFVYLKTFYSMSVYIRICIQGVWNLLVQMIMGDKINENKQIFA